MHGTSSGAPVILSGYGGLVTLAKPESVPEGASPRTYDTDYDVGSVGTRDGLTSVYSFGGSSVGPNPGTAAVDVALGGFAWSNLGGILLNDSSYASCVLAPAFAVSSVEDGIVDIVVGPVHHTVHFTLVTFEQETPAISSGQTYTFSGLTAYTSLNGQVLTPVSSIGTLTPAVNQALFQFGTSFGYADTPDTGQAVVSPAVVISSDGLSLHGFGFNLPSTATVIGFMVAVKGFASASTGLTAQLLKNGMPVGTPEPLPLPSSDGFIYFGGNTDTFGTTWACSDVNSTMFGVQLIATGMNATVDLDFCTIQVNISNESTNFQYITTFTAQNGDVKNVALDALGNFWIENVTTNPGVLTLALNGITPGSYAVGVNGPDVEYLAFTNLSTGSDMPRQYTPNWIDRITQVGPGTAPSFSPIVSNTDTYPIVSITQFPQQSTDRSGTPGGGKFCAILWSQGPLNTSSGNVVTVYYAEGPKQGGPAGGDPDLYEAWNSGQTVYVYITNAAFGNGVHQITSVGLSNPPGTSQLNWYFTFNMTTSNYQFAGSFPTGQYQLTVGTLAVSAPIPGLTVGNNVTVAGASVAAWDNTWQITQALNSAQLTITETAVASYIATYSWSVSQGTPPVTGQLVNITGTTNANALLNGSNLVIASSTAFGGTVNTSGTAVTWVSGDHFTGLTGSIVINGTSYTIASVTSSTALVLTTSASVQSGVTFNAGTLTNGTFTTASVVESAASAPEDGLATTAGTIFTIDPGPQYVGGSSNPILGNSTGGTLTYIGADAQLIGTGTRKGTVFFITRNGYYTAPAPPVEFTLPENCTGLIVANLPIGPPNVVKRGVAITEPGQNGVPGGNYFTIPTPVQYTVNNVSYTATSLYVNDNTTTSTTFAFTDSVLLNALAIDVYGYNLFNQIEIGDPGWIASYDSRGWYGRCLNKIQNFNNLSFDGGYSSQLFPLGWTQTDSYGSLIPSPKFGNSYYIQNSTESVLPVAGLISQSAYEDAYLNPIIDGNTAYSVRVSCSNPSGIQTGSLVIALAIGGVTYGSFSIPLASMGTSLGYHSGTLLVDKFATVPSGLLLNVYASELGAGADVLVDRIDPYPTDIPILSTVVFGSYAGLFEQVDAVTGRVECASENQQPVNGAVVLYDTLYFLKGWAGTNPGSSLYSFQKSSNLEPAQWDEPEVAQRSGGAIGPLAFDLGEQWFVAAVRSGLYLFVGGQPGKISQEIYQVWDSINWDAGNTIWVKVDIIHRRIYIGVPLPTPNFWLPNAPVNAMPTSPNVMLVCDYKGIDSGEQLKTEPQMHTTMFGSLNSIDMRRKWSIWQIPAPYANFVASTDDEEFYICNGRATSKVYKLDPTAETDDGQPIDSLYTTAGLVELSKRAATPGVGSNRMRWGYMVAALESLGNIGVTLYPNRLLGPGYAPEGYNSWQLPGGFAPGSPALNDAEAPLNFAATRTYVEFRENDGHAFTLSNLMLHAKRGISN